MTTPWQFATTPRAPRRPHVMLFVFGAGPLRDGELSMATVGAPSREALATLEVHPIEIAAGVRWCAVEDEHRIADVLQLNNAARVIVDERGRDLMGVMSRLPLPS